MPIFMDKGLMLKQIKEYLKLTKNADFAKFMGISEQNSYTWTKRKTFDPATILAKCPEINADWLLTGEGEMLKNKPMINYTTGVPYYNVDFIGGFDIVYNDQTVKPDCLVDFPQYRKATCWCNITGHSMEPEISHGDIIALMAIDDISFLPYGEIYAIVTTNGLRTVKRIGPASSSDNYALIPTNKSPEYGIQEIPKKSIYKVYQVLGCVKKL